MNKDVLLYYWGNGRRTSLFRINNGKYILVKGMIEGEYSGILKKFLFGRKLAVYKYEDRWWIQYRKIKMILSNPELRFIVKRYGIFTKITVDFGGTRLDLIDVSFYSFIGPKIDPTYDAFDLNSDDFVHWLKDLREKDKGPLISK